MDPAGGRATIAAALVIAPILVVPPVLAGHGGDPITSHVTYEIGPTWGYGNLEDPVGITQDNSIDTGGAKWFGDEMPRGVDKVQVTIIDDVWGGNVIGASVATDENGNNIYGEEENGEVSAEFCGTSPVVDIPPAPAWDAVIVFAGQPYRQYLACDPTAAPTGATTGGVVNPHGGIYGTFE